jgi:thiosulfate dehydrogenase (quinone) large subunit
MNIFPLLNEKGALFASLNPARDVNSAQFYCFISSRSISTVMTNSPISPLRADLSSSQDLVGTERWKQRSIAALRILFGLIWVVAAWLKWAPDFQNSFASQVSGAESGQPGIVQGWITFWANIINTNPLLFARLEGGLETAIAIFLIFGVLSNLTYFLGILLSLGIWSIAEGFGGPYVSGQSTDVGTALPYAVIFAVLLVVSAGRYYSVDHWLTRRLGRFGFLASGPIKQGKK